jgi:hypothetical protein
MTGITMRAVKLYPAPQWSLAAVLKVQLGRPQAGKVVK